MSFEFKKVTFMKYLIEYVCGLTIFRLAPWPIIMKSNMYRRFDEKVRN